MPDLLFQTGHYKPIHSIVFSPDGRLIATGGQDGIINLWLIDTGEILCTLEGHNDSIWSLSFSPDGQILASGSNDTTVKLWDISRRKLVSTLEGHNDRIETVFFSPDNFTIATLNSKIGHIWDIISGKTRATIDGHSGLPASVSFNSTGRLFATGSRNRNLKLWDTATGKLSAILDKNNSGIECLSFSPDGKYLVTGGWDNKCKIWDLELEMLCNILEGHNACIWSISISPDGNKIATGSRDGTVIIWHLKKGKILNKVTLNNSSDGVFFLPDGERLLTVGWNKCNIFDVKSVKSLASFEGHRGTYLFSLSPHNKTIAIGDNKNIIRIFNSHGEIIKKITCNSTDVVHHVKMTHKNNAFVMVCDDGIKVRDVNTGRVITGNNELSDKFSWRDINFEYMTSNDCRMEELKKILNLSSIASLWNDMYIMSYSYDGKKLATVHRYMTCIWDMTSGNILKSPLYHSESIYYTIFSPDGNSLATGGCDNSIKLWDIYSGRIVKKFNGHKEFITSIAFSPDGHFIASGSHDETVRVWDIKSGDFHGSMKGHRGDIYTIAFSPDGKIFATGGKDAVIRLWNTDGMKFFNSLVGHRGTIFSLSFSHDGKILASGSGDTSVKFWDIPSGSLLGTYFELNHCNDWVLFTPDGYFDGTIRGISKLKWKKWDEIDKFEEFYRPGLLGSLLRSEK